MTLTADTTNESQEVSPFPAGDRKLHINRRAQRHSKHKTDQKHKRSKKEVPPWNSQENILLEGLNRLNGAKSDGRLEILSGCFMAQGGGGVL